MNVQNFSSWLSESQRWSLPLETVEKYVEVIASLLPKRGLSKVQTVPRADGLETVHFFFRKRRFNEDMKYCFEVRGYVNEMSITHVKGHPWTQVKNYDAHNFFDVAKKLFDYAFVNLNIQKIRGIVMGNKFNF